VQLYGIATQVVLSPTSYAPTAPGSQVFTLTLKDDFGHVVTSGIYASDTIKVTLTAGTNKDYGTLNQGAQNVADNDGSCTINVPLASGTATFTYIDPNTLTPGGSGTISIIDTTNGTITPVGTATIAVAKVPIATKAITGVTAPVYGETPVITATETAEYTAAVTWAPGTGTSFGISTFTATITLTPKTGYTLTGVDADFFTVDGATTVTNTAGSGIVSAVFPATAAPPPVQATPTFNPVAGAVALESTVTITSAEAEHIYYTTDGTDPATSVTGTTLEYTTALTINVAKTIKAIAIRAGKTNSAIAIAAYTQAASADLTALVVSGTPGNYTFVAGTYTYDGVTVDNAVASITVTPTGAGTIFVNTITATTGVAYGPIELTAGVEETIVVVVIETGKTAKTYTIKVTRAAAPVVPTDKVSGLAFSDADVATGKIWGALSWTAPANVSNVTQYVVYASADGTTKGATLGTVAVGTNNLTLQNTAYAEYIIVVTKNAVGEAIAANYVAIKVIDVTG